MATLARPKNLATYAVRRPRKSRSKNGCNVCRTRRKKCDEKRPTCSTCVKLKVLCVWPNSGDNSLTSQQQLGQNERTSRTSSTPDDGRRVPNSELSPTTVLSDGTDLTRWLSQGCFPEDGTPSPQSFNSPQARSLAQHLVGLGILSESRGQPVSKGLGIEGTEGEKIDLLFDHFRHATASWLLNSDQHHYLVQNHVIPLARTDTLLLHSLLAICASHVCAEIPSFETDALEHYTSALTELNHLLCDESRTKARGYRSLLCAIIFLSHYEINDGKTYGAALQHVRACRKLVHEALAHLDDPAHQDLAVFLIENYGYFVLLANVTGSPNELDVRLGLEFSSWMLPQVRDRPGFGSMLATEPATVYLAPLLAQFSYKRENMGPFAAQQQLQYLHTVLQGKLYYPNISTQAGHESLANVTGLRKLHLVKDIKTVALMVFLHGTCGLDSGIPAAVKALQQSLIEQAMMLVTYVQITDASYGLFWAWMVLGSFLVNTHHRELLISKLQQIPARFPAQKRSIELLRLLWDDAENAELGIVGLEKVAFAQGVNSFMC